MLRQYYSDSDEHYSVHDSSEEETYDHWQCNVKDLKHVESRKSNRIEHS